MRKLEKVLKDANETLKKEKYLMNYQIVINGNFSSKYNEVRLEYDCSCFPICNAETEGEAIAAINAYMTGFRHGQENSYVQYKDKNY